MLKSTQFVVTSGIFTHMKAPSTRPNDTCTYHPAWQLGGNCETPHPYHSPCLVWRGWVLFVTIRATRCGSSNNSYSRNTGTRFTQYYVACCRVGGSRRRGGRWLCRLYRFWYSISRQRNFFLICGTKYVSPISGLSGGA